MNKDLTTKLITNVQNLNVNRQRQNLKGIASSYKQIGQPITDLYKTPNAQTALFVEKTLVSGEQNNIDKTSATHKAISDLLGKLNDGQTADIAQRKNPAQYHSGAMIDHAAKHSRDGTAFDAVRVALADCRKHAKNQITAIGADENQAKRECNIIRYNGLVTAERNYIERQVEHRVKYTTPEVKKQTQQNIIKAFDMKIRTEQRELKMTPG